MNQPNVQIDPERERARAAAQAQAELLRLAAEQGVKPITDIAELYGEPVTDDDGNDDVDDFLAMLREWRAEGRRSVDSGFGG
jgi:hypothetical protein